MTVHIPRQVKDESSLHFEWSPIIPNSDILIIPPPQIAIEGIENIWYLDVMISPTKKMLMVSLLIVISLVVIGFMIIHLNKKEREEDKEDQ